MIQKQLIAKARRAGKPIITATQMLESMTTSRLPTRAESTDVANAILDGTDCIMLSGESAMGKYPEEAVAMLAKIAAYTEAHRPPARADAASAISGRAPATAAEAMAPWWIMRSAAVPCAAVFVPTRTGATARMISRFSPGVWIVAVSRDAAVCQGLVFSYGVHPVQIDQSPENWRDFIRRGSASTASTAAWRCSRPVRRRRNPAEQSPPRIPACRRRRWRGVSVHGTSDKQARRPFWNNPMTAR